MSDSTTFVIGLDGAHWELLDPWLDEGRLPTLQRVREEGVWGDLESQLPPVTCPNWKCYATGKNPGKLGAFWWELLDGESRTIGTVDATVFDSAELWDYLNAEGLATAVVNMPTTYPPRAIDGCLIAGGPDAATDEYTYPADLQSELEASHDYKLRPTDVGLLPENAEQVGDDVCDIIDTRFDVALELADDHEFVHLTIFYINVLQHFFWRDDVVRRAWERIDENLERVLDRGDDIVLMADHGSNAVHEVFNVNVWLEREGYLVLERGTADYLSVVGVTAENVRRTLGLLGDGWYSRIKSWAPDAMQERVPEESGSVTGTGKAEKIDWEASQAVAGGQGPVYLLTDNPTVQKRLISDLEAVKSPVSGTSPVQAVHPVESVYHGNRMDNAPDIVLEQAPNWHITGDVGGDAAFGSPDRWAAENKRTGLFAMHGESFESTATADSLSILNLAPTILHLFGLPVPETMDGEVVRSVFSTGSEPAMTDPEYAPEYGRTETRRDDVTDDARDRLEDLGYL